VPNSSSFAADDPEPLLIRPRSGLALDLPELWRYRELVGFLTWRNILVRYKQTALGVAWAVLQPLIFMLILTVIARRASLPTNGLPKPVFYYAGLLPWFVFATSAAQSVQSLVGSQNLISKVYFPRLVLPAATVLATLLDLLVGSVLLIVLLLVYGLPPRPAALALVPAILLLAFIASLGVSLWLSALNVAYRDVQYVVPFLIQTLFLLTVVYPASLFDEPLRSIAGINPMAGVVEGFRWALLETEAPPGGMVLVSAAVALAILVGGVAYFRAAEREFADIV
jgi:lipopolysaccharide transport system permease protein